MQRRNNQNRPLVAALTTASLAMVVALSFAGVFGAGRAEAPKTQLEPFIGQIQAFGFNFAPRGWAQCDGQLLSISSNTALFSLLGTTYGGDGRTTFALPDLRGRVPMHQGTGPGLTNRRIGERSGAETVTLGANSMPSHTHTATLKGSTQPPIDLDVPTNAVLAKGNIYFNGNSDTDMGATSITNADAGGGQAHANMQPYLVVNYCIALQGVFPSRD